MGRPPRIYKRRGRVRVAVIGPAVSEELGDGLVEEFDI
jgi:hypothetical protein